MKLLRSAATAVFALVIASTNAQAQDALTLEEAVSLALRNNERSQIATQQIEASDARVARARAFFFPDVTANSNYRHRVTGVGDDDEDSGEITGTVNLAQTVFDARSFPLYRYARLLRESTRYSATNDRRNLAFDTADAFILTLSQQQVVAAAERRRDFAQQSVSDARARFEAGLVSSNDVTRAELELASAELALSRALNGFETSRLQLANLIAAPIDGPLAEPVTVLAEASDQLAVSEETIAAAVQRRPDVASLRSNAAALDEFAKEPSRRIIPNVTLNGQYQNSEANFGGREDDAFVTMNVGWNAFDGGEREADRAERLALAAIAELNAEAAARRVRTEVETAATGVRTERASIEQAGVAASTARRNATETAELYRQGLASSLEVADAAIRRFEAEVAEARARYQLALAFLDWRYVVGLWPFGGETE